MQQINHSGRRPGLLAQLTGLVVGLVAMAVAVFLGALFIAAVVGFALILGLIVYLRAWWVSRQLKSRPGDSSYIEAEYEVIETRESRD